MPSSTSSSDVNLQENSHPQVAVLETPVTFTGPPRRGFERTVPALPWLRIFCLAASATLLLMVGWELEMRHLGLRAGDLDDERGYWTAERRKIDAGPRDSVVIIGDSRILLDTDLATWEKLTGHRPIQLALLGTNAGPVLHDLAADEHFAGLLVLGTAEFSYFSFDAGSMPGVLKYIKIESPSQRIGQQLYKILSRYFAFLDSNYTMFRLIERHQWRERRGVDGPYIDVWKISETYDDRQTYLWDRLEQDPYLREHAQLMWTTFFTGPVVTADLVDRVSASTQSDIARIRARGGEVVWIRPPSTGPILDIERGRFPRPKVWDRLVHDSASFGIYFEDYANMRELPCPDWSHLSKASAIEFTDAYVRVLRENVEWLKNHDTLNGGDNRLNSSR